MSKESTSVGDTAAFSKLRKVSTFSSKAVSKCFVKVMLISVFFVLTEIRI